MADTSPRPPLPARGRDTKKGLADGTMCPKDQACNHVVCGSGVCMVYREGFDLHGPGNWSNARAPNR